MRHLLILSQAETLILESLILKALEEAEAQKDLVQQAIRAAILRDILAKAKALVLDR
jgi:hypothetical protein